MHVVRLKTPIKYAVKGNNETAHEVTLAPPVHATMKKAAKIAQFFLRAAQEAQEAVGMNPEAVQALAAEQDGPPGMKVEEVQALILSSSQDLDPLYDAFEGILTSSAYLDEKVLMKKAVIERMDPDDFNNLMFEYIVNFTIPSLS
jgi:hypothetical protein